MRYVLSALAVALPTALHADINRIEATGGVMEVMHELEEAVSEAGATIFARVPHSKGAASVGEDLVEAELLIFGSPRMGTPVMQQDIHAGLVLPLRMLVYTDADGQTWVAWEDVDDMFEGMGVDTGSEIVGDMRTALETFARTAAD